MKKQYVAIVVIIVIMMAVLLGVYKVGNSVIFDSFGEIKTLADGRNKLINLIKITKTEEYKNNKIEVFTKYNSIELNQIDKFY